MCSRNGWDRKMPLLLNPSKRRYAKKFDLIFPGYSTNEWIRISMFSYNVYHFLAVDHDVCQLSPNSGAILDSNELYSPPTLDTFLFVGGYLYAKSPHTFHQINPEFRKKHGEKTREKPPSLRVSQTFRTPLAL